PLRIMSANEPARRSAGGTGDPVTQMEIGSAGASGMRNPLSDPGGAPREGAPLRPRSAVACRCEETLDDSRRLLSDLVGRWYPIVAEEQRREEAPVGPRADEEVGDVGRRPGTQHALILELAEQLHERLTALHRPMLVVAAREIGETLPLDDREPEQRAVPRRRQALESAHDVLRQRRPDIAAPLEPRRRNAANRLVDDGPEQVLLRREVAVQRRLRAARRLQHRFDRRRDEAVPEKELGGRLDDSLETLSPPRGHGHDPPVRVLADGSCGSCRPWRAGDGLPRECFRACSFQCHPSSPYAAALA